LVNLGCLKKGVERQMYQLSLGDYQASQNRIVTRAEMKLTEIDKIVKWDRLVELMSVIDKTDKHIGGRPRKETLMMTKILFIQHLYNLSDPELEDQLNDRLSFQRFAGIGFDMKVPDYSTIWRFKEALIKHKLFRKIFDLILDDLKLRGLILKKGTIVDATIIQSYNRPLSEKKREELQKNPSRMFGIDMDAKSTKKNGKYHYGYKGHIGTDVKSKLIRRASFTSANVHDSQEMVDLISGDEQSIFGDKAYFSDKGKHEYREKGIFYGILNKGKRGHKLSGKQIRQNKRHSSIRSQVEHPFAYMKRILNYKYAKARNLARNELRFMMNCIVYNLLRGSYLIKKAA